jgi:hypothetical protein
MTQALDPKRLPVYRPLPCHPCPHGSSCCHYGVSLVGDEADHIGAIYGQAALEWDAEDNEFRTTVVDGKCFFLVNNACSIHDKPYYPRICRGFPWVDGETGAEYGYDRTICRELA